MYSTSRAVIQGSSTAGIRKGKTERTPPDEVCLLVGATTAALQESVTRADCEGRATNLAARLQTAAAGGEILLSDEAFRRVGAWLGERGLTVAPEVNPVARSPIDAQFADALAQELAVAEVPRLQPLYPRCDPRALCPIDYTLSTRLTPDL